VLVTATLVLIAVALVLVTVLFVAVVSVSFLAVVLAVLGGDVRLALGFGTGLALCLGGVAVVLGAGLALEVALGLELDRIRPLLAVVGLQRHRAGRVQAVGLDLDGDRRVGVGGRHPNCALGVGLVLALGLGVSRRECVDRHVGTCRRLAAVLDGDDCPVLVHFDRQFD